MSLPCFCLVFAVSLPCLVLCCGRGLRPFAMTCPAVSVLQCHCCVFPCLCCVLLSSCSVVAVVFLVYAWSLPCLCRVSALSVLYVGKTFAVSLPCVAVSLWSLRRITVASLPLAHRAHCHGYAPDWPCQFAIYVFSLPRAPRSEKPREHWHP